MFLPKYIPPLSLSLFLCVVAFTVDSSAQIVITEILKNPASVGDIDGEWFELHNPTPFALDVNGWTISDNGTNIHTIENGGSLAVPAGGFIVIGRRTNQNINGNVLIAYAYGLLFELDNSEDEIILTDAFGSEVDRVEYNSVTFPTQAGASMELIAVNSDNNNAINWGTALTQWGDTDYGSPGDWNSVSPPNMLSAFPGAEGFGALSRGGRGGKIIFVTNLDSVGTGSLLAALEDPDPRIVLFKLGGTIQLQRDINIESPYLTVAGQSAPGGGICVSGATIDVKTHDVIIRGLRVRAGDNPVGPPGGNRDCLRISHDSRAPYKVILDHCSTSWGIDEEISTDHKAVHDVTIQWCIASEGLRYSLHPEGGHSMGLLIGQNEETYNVSLHHNLFVHNTGRNPRIANSAEAEVINNVSYNFDDRGLDIGNEPGENAKVNAIGNVYVTGFNTPPNRQGITVTTGPGMQLYVEDNIGPGRETNEGDDWLVVDGDVASRSLAPPIPLSGMPVHDVDEVVRIVLANAGAVTPVRDVVDKRIARDVLQRTGQIIDSQDDVGGWPMLGAGTPLADTDNDGMPDLWELANGLNPVDPADRNADLDADGYQSIEEYVNSLISPSPTIAYAGEDQTLCGSSTTLSGNVPLLGSGRWLLFSASGTVTEPFNPFSTVTGLTPGVHELEWAISANSVGTRDTVRITIYDAPPFPADAGPDQQVCNSTQAQLAAVPPTVGTGLWRIVMGTGSIEDPTNPSTDINGLGAGLSAYEWTVTQYGNCFSSDTVSINSLVDPTANFAWQIVGGLTVQFTSTSTGATSWLWTFGDGETSNAENPVHTYSQIRSYRVRLTATNDCGSRTRSRRINITGAVGMLGATPEIVDFGTVQPGGLAESGLPLSNIGLDTLDIDSVSTSSRIFRVTQFPSIIAPDAASDILIRFQPEESGPFEAELSLYVEEEVTTIQLTGSCDGPGTMLRAEFDGELRFEQRPSGSQTEQPLVIVFNHGTRIESIAIHQNRAGSFVLLNVDELTTAPSPEKKHTQDRDRFTVADVQKRDTVRIQVRYFPEASTSDTSIVWVHTAECTRVFRITGEGTSPDTAATVQERFQEEETRPVAFTLSQNYPNPFNPATEIRYALPFDAAVSIVIYDALGRVVRTLVNEVLPAGFHSVLWDGSNDNSEPLGSGVYLYRIQAGPFVEARKMLLIK